MAEGVLVGAVVGDAISKLSDVIVHVAKETWQFRSKLTQIQATITRIKPIFNQIEKLNAELDQRREETNMFINHLIAAENLIRKCEHIKWNFFKRYKHSLKLDELNASLLEFFQFDVLLQEARDVKEVLVVVKDVQKRMETGSSSCGWLSGVPLLKGVVIGFDDRVKDLKAMVVKDSEVDDCSVTVVSGIGGSGKTTLVTMLCHDPDIQGKFGRNIYFATISETPNIKVVIKNLLEKNQASQQLDFTSDEDAINKWGSFLGENRSEILLVLDDVWSDSIIKQFKFKLRGYKILVTSRIKFTQFNTYELQLLNDHDATNLFCYSAFSKCRNERTDIPDYLVAKLVMCCKKHPLALSVVGGLLKGAHVARWHFMLNNLSEGQQCVLDLDEDMRLCLARSLDLFKEESEIKECYLDLGLFPEDQKIAATTLMDIWAHLYNHDEKGLATLNNLFELSSKNLANLFPIRKDSFAICNFCEENGVMQHDMMRMLAINLSSQKQVQDRKRLIINANGQHLPQLPQTVNARIFSISTDESFSFKWNDIRTPNVEVFVLNIMSEIYTLPQFMQNMEQLKVLIIINYGYYFSKLQNLPKPQYLSGLTTLRLEHISISSVSTSILELANLQKLSLIMCKIGNCFNERILIIPNKLQNLLEMDIDSCDDFITYPSLLCNLVRLRKLSITNCHELTSLSEDFGNLTNLEVLRLASCSNLKSIPEAMKKFQKLSIIDISHCLHLCDLPPQIGKLGGLKTIHMRGCTGLHDLPLSVKDLCPLEVVCDEEIGCLWRSRFGHVKVQVVEEDRVGTFLKIVPRDMRVE